MHKVSQPEDIGGSPDRKLRGKVKELLNEIDPRGDQSTIQISGRISEQIRELRRSLDEQKDIIRK